jgi:hypothetical protein
MSDDANTLLKHQEQLESNRSNFTSWWQDIAQRVLPSHAVFESEDDQGRKRSERMFDPTASTCNDRFAAVMDDLHTPRTQRWHGLMPYDDELGDDQESKAYLERLTNLLFAIRYRPRANFAGQQHQTYLSVGAFGNSTLFIDEEVGVGPRYQHIHTRESFWAENHQGVIDTHYRKFKLEARQAMQRFGKALPKRIADAATDKPFDKFEFLHCVKPNEERAARRLDYRGMPWSSFYVAYEGKTMLESSGFTSWPFGIGRYMLAPGEVYARSPAMTAWPAILTLNEEKKTVLRAGQLGVHPPVLLSEEGALGEFNMRSSALNYGLLTDQGEPLAKPFVTGGDVPLGLELMGLEKLGIEDAFLTTIFKVLIENPQMTATQVLEIAQERAVLLAPVMGRQHSENLGPMISREIDILSRNSRYAWILDEMPEQLRESEEQYRIEYRSPLARAMRAQDGVAILRTFEAAPTAISLDPNAAFVLDVPESLRTLAEINGVPAKLVRDSKMVAQLAADAAEQQATREAVEAAPSVSDATLNAAKAAQIRSEAGVV